MLLVRSAAISFDPVTPVEPLHQATVDWCWEIVLDVIVRIERRIDPDGRAALGLTIRALLQRTASTGGIPDLPLLGRADLPPHFSSNFRD